MIETETHLLKKNAIAASIGQEIVLDILKQYREQFISQLKTIVPNSNDPYALNMQRALGRVDAIDHLISEGIRANKPSN